MFAKAVSLLAPGQCDDFSVISGSILLIVALEKLAKSVIQLRNPLMILYEKVSFEELLAQENGEGFDNRNTISFELALNRIIKLYPALSAFQRDIKAVIEDRNLLMHNYGYLEIARLERNVQVRVADFAEALCNDCLREPPGQVIGQDAWMLLQKNRDAYRNAESLELEQRIAHLQRLHTQGQPLPCQKIDINPEHKQLCMICPVCTQAASVLFDIDWDVDVDHREGVILGVYAEATAVALTCGCGFTLSTHEEVKCLLGNKEEEMCELVICNLMDERE
ncbi:hypothetical protein [Synechococcus sp. CCY 0621]|uniref:hypothetical protein n=1 Tax=Synechococcus sp. CCY 0621 TaxID=2815603 RepID=UPI001C233491|nr:hypothetical protein [Synechococcus sp. CCY 0621]